jgi:hypothetical protein
MPKISGVNISEHIQIDKAVVQRRDQNVGHGMGKLVKKMIVAGGVYDNVSVLARQILDRLRQPLPGSAGVVCR